MSKDTRIAFRAPKALKNRLVAACKKLHLGESTVAEAAVLAAVEYIEQHGGIWFPLAVVSKPRDASVSQFPLEVTSGDTDLKAAEDGAPYLDPAAATPPLSPGSVEDLIARAKYEAKAQSGKAKRPRKTPDPVRSPSPHK